jgi:hypothetical protein
MEGSELAVVQVAEKSGSRAAALHILALLRWALRSGSGFV